VVDLFPSCNCRVQMEIWLKDRDTRNQIYLFLLTTWTPHSLNWTRTSAQRFWKRPRVVRLFEAGWTRVMISRRSETNHYNTVFMPYYADVVHVVIYTHKYIQKDQHCCSWTLFYSTILIKLSKVITWPSLISVSSIQLASTNKGEHHVNIKKVVEQSNGNTPKLVGVQ